MSKRTDLNLKLIKARLRGSNDAGRATRDLLTQLQVALGAAGLEASIDKSGTVIFGNPHGKSVWVTPVGPGRIAIQLPAPLVARAAPPDPVAVLAFECADGELLTTEVDALGEFLTPLDVVIAAICDALTHS